MITIKNKQAIQKMEEAGTMLSAFFLEIPSLLRVGMTTLELDSTMESILKSRGLISQAKGYGGYKYATCIAVNDEVVHGVPSARKLAEGDLVKVDICVSYKGYCADMARCFFVGGVAAHSKAQDLVHVAQLALDEGIKYAVAGNRLSDISHAVQTVVEKHGYGVVRDFAGHGIGKKMHEEPEVPNFGKPGEGPLLRVGMALAIEPMITLGDYRVFIEKDGWTVRTKDGSLAAHVEDTVVITQDGPKILTRPISEKL